MPKKIIGVVVAAVLAITGQSLAVLPAAADSPQQTLPAQTKADKAKAAARAKAANAKAAAAAKARAVARARDAYVAASGPRAAAAARAAARARTDYAAKKRVAGAWRNRATLLARGAATARARAALLPKQTKAQAAAKKKAEAVARQATKNATRAATTARKATVAANRARLVANSANQAADEARAIYVGLAGPRADLAARQAAAARNRAIIAARAVGAARAKAIATYRAGVAARAKSAVAQQAKISKKAKKKAKKAAAKATKVAARANAKYHQLIAVSERSRGLAQQLGVAASRAKAAVGPNPTWNPTDSVLFNHPRGSKKAKYTLITQLNRAIDATPAGGDIRIAMYLFDIGSVADRLIAAHRRGVSVQILLDDNTTNKWIRKVKRALGTNRSARSFFGVCDHSCMSNGTSTIHAKFYLFSVAGQSKYVSLVSSGNPYSGNTTKSWNNTHTIARDKTIYDSLNRYFTDMLPDKNNSNYYRTTTSGKYTLYYYPQKITRSDQLVWMGHLNRVSCKAAPGYGNGQRRTLIRVANWGWTTPRIDVARRLWKLHDSGCAVQVMVNTGRISRSVLKVLLKKSKRYGRMGVYNAWRDWRKKDVAGLYIHHKFATISGTMNGKSTKLTLTGSQNFTALGTTANNDLVLRVIDGKVVNQYNTNFAYIRAHYTKRLTKVPLVTRKPDRKGGV